MIYAGFWKRAVAFFIDGLVLTVPIVIISGVILGTQVSSFLQVLGSSAEPTPEMAMTAFGKYMLAVFSINIISIVLMWLYQALMESGKNQATLGKMALGIKVVGPNGERISFAHATGRFFAMFLSHFPFYFGDYMAGFTKHRQALHDLIASTYVVNKQYQEGEELAALRFSVGGLIAGLLAACAPIALYIGMMIMAMFLAVSEVGTTDLSASLRNAKRDSQLNTARMELILLTTNENPLENSVEKEGIVYSKTAEGYTAAFKDEEGNEYELLQRENDFSVCCLKGPNGKCTDNEILARSFKPCN